MNSQDDLWHRCAFSVFLLGEGDVIVEAVQSIVWHASDRRPAPIVANNSIERLGLAQWHAASLPFQALVSIRHA